VGVLPAGRAGVARPQDGPETAGQGMPSA